MLIRDRIRIMAKILFIEDEPALQKTLSEFLTVQGYEVVSAFDGETGLKLAGSEKPDLILLDLVLPRRHGLEVLADLKRDPELARLPVIVLSNVESGEAVEQATALGAKAYLVKINYSMGEVLEKIKSALGQA